MTMTVSLEAIRAVLKERRSQLAYSNGQVAAHSKLAIEVQKDIDQLEKDIVTLSAEAEIVDKINATH